MPWPPSPISCPEDQWLFVTTVLKHWTLTISSLCVQYCRNVVTNTTQLTHWIPSLRQFSRFASWNSDKKQDSSIWYEWSDILYNSSLDSPQLWWNLLTSTSPKKTYPITWGIMRPLDSSVFCGTFGQVSCPLMVRDQGDSPSRPGTSWTRNRCLLHFGHRCKMQYVGFNNVLPFLNYKTPWEVDKFAFFKLWNALIA